MSPQEKKWRQAYSNQRGSAQRRGIEWRFTFESWMEWWGEDIHRRGVGSSKLCMQRVADSGPYATWNVRKAEAVWNSRTYRKVDKHARSVMAREAILAAEMAAPSIPYHGEDEVSEYAELGYTTQWDAF